MKRQDGVRCAKPYPPGTPTSHVSGTAAVSLFLRKFSFSSVLSHFYTVTLTKPGLSGTKKTSKERKVTVHLSRPSIKIGGASLDHLPLSRRPTQAHTYDPSTHSLY